VQRWPTIALAAAAMGALLYVFGNNCLGYDHPVGTALRLAGRSRTSAAFRIPADGPYSLYLGCREGAGPTSIARGYRWTLTGPSGDRFHGELGQRKAGMGLTGWLTEFRAKAGETWTVTVQRDRRDPAFEALDPRVSVRQGFSTLSARMTRFLFSGLGVLLLLAAFVGLLLTSIRQARRERGQNA
jgi:hypothetical protein